MSWARIVPRYRLICDLSVRIDVDQLLRDREAERIQAALEAPKAAKAKSPRKRKAEGTENAPKAKKPRTKVPKSEHSSTAPPTPGPASTSTSSPAPPKPIAPKVTLKLGPQPKEPDVFPCCLCVSMKREGLLRVQDPPLWRPEGQSGGASAAGDVWMAHEECANVVPETWVDEVDVGEPRADGTRAKERVVLGVDGIVKDRWNLVSLKVCCPFRPTAHFDHRNATFALRRATRRMALLSSARRAGVRKHSTSRVHGMAPVSTSFSACSERLRRRLSLSTLSMLLRQLSNPLPLQRQVLRSWTWTKARERRRS